MSSLLSAARKDLRRFLRDPWAMVFWLGLPLVIGALVELAIGGHHGRPERPRLLVADQDDSFASRLLRNAAREGQLGELFAIEEIDQPSGRAALDAGEATALAIIPAGFGAAVLADKPTRLTLVTNPEERIRPRMIEEMLDLVCDAVFYAQRLVRGDVRVTDDGATGEASRAQRLAAGTARLGRTALLVERYALPPVIELETAAMAAETSGFRLGRLPFLAHYLPGIVFLAMLFASQGLAGDIWRERETGVLRRVVTTPLGITRLLAAKLLAAALVLAGLALTVLVIGMLYTELPMARLPLALVWSTAAGVMLTAMMLLLQVFATTHRGAQVLSFAVVMPLMILGGSIFPIEVMPPWMAAVGRATPNGWAGAELKAIVLGRVPEVPIALGFALLAATGLAFIAAAAWQTSRVFARR